MLRRTLITLSGVALLGVAAFAQTPNAGQGGFVPLDQMPPGQELPAAQFVIASYAFFLILMMFYLWTIWRRIGKVEKDMRDLERRQGTLKG